MILTKYMNSFGSLYWFNALSSSPKHYVLNEQKIKYINLLHFDSIHNVLNAMMHFQNKR